MGVKRRIRHHETMGEIRPAKIWVRVVGGYSMEEEHRLDIVQI